MNTTYLINILLVIYTFQNCNSPKAQEHQLIEAYDRSNLEKHVFEGKIGEKLAVLNLYWQPQVDKVFYGIYFFKDAPQKKYFLNGIRISVSPKGLKYPKLILGNYQEEQLFIYLELYPQDDGFQNLSGRVYKDSEQYEPIELKLIEQHLKFSKEELSAFKVSYTNTIYYTGQVGKLPVKVLLHTNKDQTLFLGAYYYPTYQANKVYTLKGNFTFATCNSDGEVLPDGNLINFKEYDRLQHTADILLCKKYQSEKINPFKGSMQNTDGKTYQVELKLIE